MKLKTIAAGLGLLTTLGMAKAQDVQVIDMSTGMQNGTMMALGSADGEWSVTPPGGSPGTAWVCSTGNVPSWGNSNCSRWLTYDIRTDNFFPKSVPAGDYTFTFTFTYSGELCDLQSAVVNLNQIAADNNLLGLRFNGNNYAINAPAADDFSIITHAPINLNIAQFVQGTNTVAIRVNTPELFVGLKVCGNVTITTASPLQATVTGPTVVCDGSPFTATGSDGPGTALSHTWEVVECTSGGTPIGQTLSSVTLSGVPGNYTFANNSLLYPCGKYYRIKLRVSGTCNEMSEATMVVFKPCRPPVDAGPNVTICEGDCVTIGTPGSNKVSYLWTTVVNGNTVVAGTTAQITVCPTETATYVLTTSTSLGCSNMDAVVVTVEHNNPLFSLSGNTTQSAYFTLSATPAVTPVNYMWIVEELDASNNPLFVIGGAGLWNTVNTAFPGFDDVANNYSGAVNTLPALPAQGRFLYNKTYRITHGTWTTYCPWEQMSQIVTIVKSLGGVEAGLVFTEDKTAPDFSYLVHAEQMDVQEIGAENALRVYPNPSTDRFVLEWGNDSPADVEVRDLLGKKVAAFSRVSPQVAVDLSGHAKGIYMLTVTVNGVKHTQKIVLQ